MIGWRKITPPRMLRIVPFGDFHICLRSNSSTRASSGVIVAHFTPTPYSLDRVRRVDGDLVVGAVALLDAEVVVLQVDVEVGQDQLLLDEVPDDPGHLVAVELDDRVLDLDLRHAEAPLADWLQAGLGAAAAKDKAAIARAGPRRLPVEPGPRRIRRRVLRGERAHGRHRSQQGGRRAGTGAGLRAGRAADGREHRRGGAGDVELRARPDAARRPARRLAEPAGRGDGERRRPGARPGAAAATDRRGLRRPRLRLRDHGARPGADQAGADARAGDGRGARDGRGRRARRRAVRAGARRARDRGRGAGERGRSRCRRTRPTAR